ncbi:hypothetical protein GE09DRAFT_1140976 [Coniochaeta sp. 2T2.1]|nr:hypothetical protein GE09DRAFT_1140976 [Coniochaeta sp. 2T2.1]
MSRNFGTAHPLATPVWKTWCRSILLRSGVRLPNMTTPDTVRRGGPAVRRTLLRLVIDMPLRADYENVEERNMLREGFAGLSRLEEFVSVRDELFLSQGRANADAEFWHRIGSMGKLECVVLIRADGIRDSDCCIKTEFASRAPGRATKVVLANVHEFEHIPVTQTWSAADPEGKVKVVLYDVPYNGDSDVIEVCQEHVKLAAIEGTIWQWDGHDPSLKFTVHGIF